MATIEQYHFKMVSCQPIDTYESQYLQKNNDYYRLCMLD